MNLDNPADWLQPRFPPLPKRDMAGLQPQLLPDADDPAGQAGPRSEIRQDCSGSRLRSHPARCNGRMYECEARAFR